MSRDKMRLLYEVLKCCTKVDSESMLSVIQEIEALEQELMEKAIRCAQLESVEQLWIKAEEERDKYKAEAERKQQEEDFLDASIYTIRMASFHNIKRERDTWKMACELQFEYLNSIPGTKDYTSEYWYNQAKEKMGGANTILSKCGPMTCVRELNHPGSHFTEEEWETARAPSHEPLKRLE